MFLLWYFSCVFWLLPAVLIGHAVRSGIVGVAIFITAIILQTWISGIAYFLKEFTKRGEIKND